MPLLDLELLFGSFTNLFVLGWLCLFVAVFIRETSPVRKHLLMVGGRIIPLMLLSMFVVGWMLTRGLPGDITSFDGVLLGFSVPEKVMLAWFEILGFALIVGRWIIEDGLKTGAAKPIVAVSLIGAFFAVAIGLVVYLVMTRVFAHQTAVT